MASKLNSMIESYNQIMKLVDVALTAEQNQKFSEALYQYQDILIKTAAFLQTDITMLNGVELSEAQRVYKRVSDVHANVQEAEARVRQCLEKANLSKCLPTDEVIFSIDSNVQYYRISASGEVSIPSYPSSLVLFLRDYGTENALAMIQVGDWSCRLLAGRTPILVTKNGPIMFYDAARASTSDCIGVLLPPSLTDNDLDLLFSALSALALVRMQGDNGTTIPAKRDESESIPATSQATSEVEVRPSESMEIDREEYRRPMPTGMVIASGIDKASQYVASGLVYGAGLAGRLIRYGSDNIGQRISPPAQPAQVGPKTQQTVTYLRQGSHAVVYASSKLVNLVGSATKHIGRAVAPTVSAACNRHLPESWKQPSTPGSGITPLGEVALVASSGISGFACIWEGLETSGKVLGRELVSSTSTLVQQKYGNDASKATRNVLYSAGNVGMTAFNVTALGPKGIAKAVAKNTGTAIAENYAAESTSGHTAATVQGGYNSNRPSDRSPESPRKMSPKKS